MVRPTSPDKTLGVLAAMTNQRCYKHLFCCLILLALSTIVFAAPAAADGLNLGTAGNYALVDLGNGTTLGLNSGPINGSVLLGNGVNAAFSGGNNGQITGTLFYDSTVTGTNTFSQLQIAPTTMLVSTSVTSAALTSANNVAAFAASLVPTQTLGTINSATTFTGNGGLNVIDVTSIQNAPLTFKGTASDIFVINVSGTFQTNQTMTLNGVLPSQILFNFTGTLGNVFQTSGGDVLFGTFLAADGGSFNFSNLSLTGELINTDGDVQYVSGSRTPTFSSFTMPTPEPGTLLSLFSGLLALAGFRRRRFAKS